MNELQAGKSTDQIMTVLLSFTKVLAGVQVSTQERSLTFEMADLVTSLRAKPPQRCDWDWGNKRASEREAALCVLAEFDVERVRLARLDAADAAGAIDGLEGVRVGVVQQRDGGSQRHRVSLVGHIQQIQTAHEAAALRAVMPRQPASGTRSTEQSKVSTPAENSH